VVAIFGEVLRAGFVVGGVPVAVYLVVLRAEFVAEDDCCCYYYLSGRQYDVLFSSVSQMLVVL
jgi:hypothetical protein